MFVSFASVIENNHNKNVCMLVLMSEKLRHSLFQNNNISPASVGLIIEAKCQKCSKTFF